MIIRFEAVFFPNFDFFVTLVASEPVAIFIEILRF